MKILLTGFKGFIGSHLLKALRKNNDVIVFEWGQKLPSLKGLDWVIHTGAISSTTERDVNRIFNQNYDFSVELYEQCRFNNVKFQFSSSASVYGLNTEFKEDSPVDPRTPYAWSKYLFERYMEKHPLSVWQGFRYFNVYGPEGEENKGDQASPFFKFKTQSETFNCVKVFSDSGKYLRDFVHVSKVVDAHIKFLDCDLSGLYNLGSGRATSFLEVAKIYSNNIIEIPMPLILKGNYQEYTCANMEKTNKILEIYDKY